METAWDFVEKYYPKYQSCNEIARANNLEIILEGGFESNSIAAKIFKNQFGGVWDEQTRKNVLNAYAIQHEYVYKIAIENYLKTL